MSRRKSKSSSLVPILILVAAVAFWVFDTYGKQTSESTREGNDPPATATVSRTGPYETFQSCKLVPDRGNDGDSFKARLPDGRVETFRLYFVDAPESAFKTYGNGENNHSRIGDQAKDLGGITPEEAVDVGKMAKDHTLSLLGKTNFTIHTSWHSPYDDRRYQAFIEFNGRYDPKFLHERLIKQGLARIYTRGAEMPDGTSVKGQKARLRELEKSAKSKEAGAWGF